MEYGLIGEKLGHSFSKEIHTKYFGLDYVLKELPPEEVGDFLTKKDFKAINVTIPYKQTVIPYLDSISDIAKKIGAVNTIVNNGGKLEGYNTDFLGLKANIEKLGLELKNKNVMILGGGATSKTAFAVAEECGAKSIVRVSRKDSADTVTYDMARSMNYTQIIINTTPVGMYPNIDGCLVKINDFPNLEGVFDVVYNPLRSSLVAAAQKRGIKASGGLYMLVGQAVFAAELFTNTRIPKEKTKSICDEIYKSKENVVLVGMPGSGKTTVGRLLAKELKRDFIDTDEEIEKLHGNITDIFNSVGESGFRSIESEIIKVVAAQQGKIIATGGGAVLNPKNIDLLRRNGKIYFIDRPLEKIEATFDRPLSSNKNELEKRYNERYEIYCNCCDKRITQTTTPFAVMDSIKEDFLG